MLSNKTSIIIISAIFSANSFAGGSSVNGVGAKGSAMQAFTAVADDASAIFYNPAGLTQLEESEIKNGVNLVFPKLQYTNSNNNINSKSTRSAVGGNLFYSKPINKKLHFGIGLYSPFARLSKYQQNAAVASPLGSTEQSAFFLRLDLVPTLAYAISDSLSIGVSGVISKGKAESNIVGLKESADGYGATAQVGLLWKVAPSLKLGVNYRGPESIKMSGSGQSTAGVYPGVPPVNGNYKIDVHYPGVLSLGVAWQVNHQLLLSGQFDNEMWSYQKQAQRVYSNTTITNAINAHNSNNYRAGASYSLNKTNSLYAGYSYVESAVPANNLVPAQPDHNQSISSIGYSYKYNNFKFDVTYEYSYFLNTPSNSPLFPGNYYGSAQNLLLDVSYKFA